ncbi:hypothetical protein GGE16_004695 [Rhizobium leguminosarum]|uniref:Uncharacterized protein n=1 Tax=Rhizobium leguminosarum TaxID=384 RepID=A0AAE2SY52_RHILE|nr:hypothetical protein [Rhizobium leguminosarum]MBB4434435.1 hypothetical protein [Rhizobium esperanzae]MBB4298854.1 hypothetical protein [Rhizobium leguminosarum]MBB4310173.1 hypothetical protein [Rhizobium leguminosarum]MBB4531331.1 hypothetical protein [Rhizobium leguminosarum]
MLRDENDFVELTGPAVFKDERKPAYLNPDGADRPLISPVPAATLDQARRYRLERLRKKMREWIAARCCSTIPSTSAMPSTRRT